MVIMDVTTVKAVLKKCELFRNLEDDELDVLIANGQFKEVPRGKILYMKGEKSNDTFCAIIAGRVNVVARDGHVVREVGSEEVIGEVALTDPNHIRTVTVIAKDPTELCEWNVNQIKDQIPGLWKKLLKLAWKKITSYYEE